MLILFIRNSTLGSNTPGHLKIVLYFTKINPVDKNVYIKLAFDSDAESSSIKNTHTCRKRLSFEEEKNKPVHVKVIL